MKKYLLTIILIILVVTFSGCNVKQESFDAYFESSIKNMREANYSTSFTVVEYTAKEAKGITGSVEYDIEQYSCFAMHKNGEYYSQEIRGNDTKERWIYKDNDCLKLLEKINGEITIDKVFDSESDKTHLIDDLLQDYATLTGKDILQTQGIKRLNFDMLKVKSEKVDPIREPYRTKIGKDKDSEYKYNWDNIKSAEKETVNLTIKKDKIDLLEAVIEYVEQRPTPSGQITVTTKHIGLIAKRIQIEANISYNDAEIPKR